MEDILKFLQQFEMWIYALLGAVGFICLRKLLIYWHEWRVAIFGLERESAQRRLSASLSLFVLLSLLGVAEFSIVTFVTPVYPRAYLLQTPTLDLLATPTETLAAAETTPNMMVKSIIGTPIPAAGDGCMPGQLEWTDPVAGGEISGVVELKGTVNVANLGFYKYEFSQPGTDIWTTIAAGDTLKQSDTLGGAWNTGQLVPGDYRLRLVVSDNQNQTLPACEIPVRVVAAQ